MRACLLLQPSGDLDQQRVAGGVAECVVDVLEAVDVEEQNGEALRIAARDPRHALGDMLGQPRAVRQARQGIEIGETGDVRLGLVPLDGECAEMDTSLHKALMPAAGSALFLKVEGECAGDATILQLDRA